MTAILLTSNGYRIVAMLHILSAVVAFGPIFFYPALHRAGQTADDRQTAPADVAAGLVLLWVLGMGLAGMSEDVYKVSQTWLVLSIINWVILMVVSWFLIRPSLTDASEPARSKLAMGSGITHLLLVVGLYLMVFKPGL